MFRLDNGEVIDMDEIMSMEMDGQAYATDGCIVEPDGTCEHGCESVLLVMGFI